MTYAVVGITMALQGYSYWSLVWALLASTMVGAVAICIATRHMPPLVPSFGGIKDLYRFGIGSTGVGLFSYIAQQADYFVVGRWLSSEALGLYTRAFTLVHVPLGMVASVLSPVLFPSFAHVQHDPARVRDILARTVSTIATITWPTLALFAVTSPELIPSVFGEQWKGAVVPVQIMAFAGMLRAVNNSSGAVAKAFGRVYDEMWRQLIYAATLSCAALLGQRWGIVGVSWGALVSTVVFSLAMAHLVCKCCHFSFQGYQRALGAPTLLALSVVLLASGARRILLHSGAPAMVTLVLTALCGVSAVGVAALCLRRGGIRRDLNDLLSVLRRSAVEPADRPDPSDGHV